MASRNLKIFLALAALALASSPALARHFRPHRPPRFPPQLLSPPIPAEPPEPFIPEGPAISPSAPMSLPPLDYGGASPPLPGGMVMTVTKILSEDPKTLPAADLTQPAPGIARPRQAADRLGACWSPPVPPRGDTVEITIRFGFDKSGSVVGAPRVTYVKPAPGISDQQVRDSLNAAIKACTPMHFTAAMAAAIPGYPISIRFIGRRADESDVPRQTP
jgi:hypothetical protein